MPAHCTHITALQSPGFLSAIRTRQSDFPKFSFVFLLILFVVFQLLTPYIAEAQTPGLIIKPATGAGRIVLDPDGDGYVSKKTYSVQLGFTNPPNNDVTQSEIPYVSFVRPDPSGDPLSGPSGSYNDIVGVDASGNNAVETYLDGNNNLLFRFRMGNYATNSKSYSVFIDTDQKFGFTGVNADPNAVPGNPGFELEVVLETNFGVEIYKIDGTTTPVLATGFALNPYSSNCQKSVSVTKADGTADYFYDFYIPFSQLSSINFSSPTVPANISTSTPLRMVALTGMNPSPNMGSNAQSDIGGVTTPGTNLDVLYSALIENQTPTSVSNIDAGGIPDRSACPTINSLTTSSTAITGTSAEASGTTINIYVYQSNGTTLLGSGATVTTGTTWSINVSALSPSVILASGYIVKATATANGKGVSPDNCSIKTVANCAGPTGTNVTVSLISGNKGFNIATTFPVGTVITWYNADYTPAVYTFSKGTNISNPVTTTSANQTVTFACQSGQCFPTGVYYFTFQAPGLCVSPYLSSCLYNVSGASAAPVIGSALVTSGTTSISGTCASTASPGATISLFADGVFLKSTTVINTTSWTISGLNLTPYSCKSVTATESDAGKCPTSSVSGVTVTHQALSPVIYNSGCSVSVPTSISGYSTEIGATVQLHKTSAPLTSIGSTTVLGTGTWTISPINGLIPGDAIQAKIMAGGCLSESSGSNIVTILTQPNILNYTIGFNNLIEGQATAGGTINGGTYPITLKLYVDSTQVGSAVSVSGAGNWTVSGLNSYDLAVGSKVQISVTAGAGCESTLSTAFTTVQCQPPTAKTISAANTTICSGNYGIITVQSSDPGVIYTPVASDGTTIFGYGAIGTGSNLNIQTYAITSNSTVVKVRASKFPIGSCDITLSGSVTFNVYPLPGVPTGVSPQTFCSNGSTTLSNLAVTAPAGCILNWYDAAQGGSLKPGSTVLVNGTTYYAESLNSTTGCISSRTAITVNQGNPAAPTANPNQTLCVGATIANLASTLSGPGTITWYNAASGGAPYSSGASLINGTYYAQTSQNSCTSLTRTAVTVTLVAIPTPSFTASVTSTCMGSTGNVYSTQTGKSNYVWTISSQGVITSGGGSSDNSVTVTWISSGTGTVSVNYSNGGCSAAAPAVSTVTIIQTGSWTGGTSTDWNTASNWSCNRIPDLTTDVLIPASAFYKPLISSGSSGAVRNLVIESGASLTVSGNSLEIAGAITNGGTFTATAGSIVMKGSSGQIIGANVFAGNTIKDLTLDNLWGLTLQGILNVTGTVKAANGNLASGGNLTLISTADQTALIDGSGAGEVTGNVTIQRYLSKRFGYKYFSSPFRGATVGQFSGYTNLGASFETFYRYDENNTSSTGESVSGWIKYITPSGILEPMHGYSVNLGTSLIPVTVSLSGVVNNGTLPTLTLTNHNKTFTQGFNFVGNPYPSPIDWDAPGGWNKTNIENAIYFFNASNPGANSAANDSLQYQGVYSSYVNGLSTGGSTNVIPAMQAFFVHVTTLSPTNATLGFSNQIRVNNLNPVFRSAALTYRPLLRLSAGYSGNPADQALIYFDDAATFSFDSRLDALKMMNTDYRMPNLYTISSDSEKLSISAMPYPSDSITRIPIGLKLDMSGRINFEALNIDQMSGYHIYLSDALYGINHELKLNQPYYMFLNKGNYENRFSILLSSSELLSNQVVTTEKFTLASTGGIWVVNLNLSDNESGILQLINMLGQVIFNKSVTGKETVDLEYNGNSGIYIISLISGNRIFSKKIIIQKQ